MLAAKTAAAFARLPRPVLLRAADALHLVSAQEHGLPEIYTSDRHMSAAARHFRLAMVTDDKSPIYRYAKRAYFIIDQRGLVRYVKVNDNPLDLLKPDEILKALKESGA